MEAQTLYVGSFLTVPGRMVVDKFLATVMDSRVVSRVPTPRRVLWPARTYPP